jgi:hypothetical protein
LRSELRPQAQAATERMQVTLADAICIEAVRGYWASLTKAFPLREPPHERRTLSEPLAAAAWRLGEIVAPLPVSEAAYHLSFLYTGLLPPEWRATDSGESRHQFRPRFQEPNPVPHQSRNHRNMAGGRFAPDHFRRESFEGSIMTLLEQALRLGRCALSEQSFADALTRRRAIQARFHRLCV